MVAAYFVWRTETNPSPLPRRQLVYYMRRTSQDRPRVLSCPVMSCPVLSFPFLSCPVPPLPPDPSAQSQAQDPSLTPTVSLHASSQVMNITARAIIFSARGRLVDSHQLASRRMLWGGSPPFETSFTLFRKPAAPLFFESQPSPPSDRPTIRPRTSHPSTIHPSTIQPRTIHPMSTSPRTIYKNHLSDLQIFLSLRRPDFRHLPVVPLPSCLRPATSSTHYKLAAFRPFTSSWLSGTSVLEGYQKTFWTIVERNRSTHALLPAVPTARAPLTSPSGLVPLVSASSLCSLRFLHGVSQLSLTPYPSLNALSIFFS